MALPSWSADYGSAAAKKTTVRLPPAPKKPAVKSAPAKAPVRKAVVSRAPVRRATSVSRASSGGSSGSSGGGVKKTSDKPQVAALEKLLSSGFKKALDQRLANIKQQAAAGDKLLLDGYDTRAESLLKLRTDNEEAEAGASWANLSNRAREAGDILTQAAAQGAGETDQLQAQLIAARNWAANQAEVNRAFFDSVGSNNAAITDLNTDTRSARFNLANQALGDQEQAYATYANQMADAATQLGNIQGNPYSDAYKSGGGKAAWDKMVSAASTAWKNPGVSAEIKDWTPRVQAKQERLNNAALESDREAERAARRPEGSTLQRRGKLPAWKPEQPARQEA